VVRYDPDLITMSSTEDMWELEVTLLESIESYIEEKKVPIIIGGVFPTFAPEICLGHRLISMVCVGEGENTLLELCRCIEEGISYNDVTNTWVKQKDGSVRRNPISKPVDINNMPLINMSLFDLARLYRLMAGRIYKMFPVETH